MIDVLRDPTKKNLHSQTRRALVRLGRQVLNPLVAVMESKDQGTLITVMGILGEIGLRRGVALHRAGLRHQAAGM